MSTTATAAITQAEDNLWMGGKSPFKASYGKLMMWFFLLSDAFTFSALLITYGLIRYSHLNFIEATGKDISNFTFSTEYWPIPEKVFEAVPFLHGIELPLVFVGIMTFILILSSVTMVLAVEAGHRMDRKNVEKWMLWTILGGITFLACQAWEWTHFIIGMPEAPTVARVFNPDLSLRWGNYIVQTGLWENITVVGANLGMNQYGPPDFAALFFFITGFHGTHVLSGVLLNFLIFYNTVTGVYDRRGHYEMVEKVGLYWHFVDLVWVFVFTFFYLI